MIVALLLWACDEPDCAPQTWYVDSDGDGFHAGILPIDACEEPEDGYVLTGGDCDDGDISASPDGAEVCDGVDNDCDGDTDEGVTGIFYTDADGDGFGDPATATEGCAAPSGTTTDGTDTDDSNPSTYPGAEEVCDGEDNDGDGEVDEDPTDAPIWYVDSDGDGFGSATQAGGSTCAAPSGAVDNNTDCDDSYAGAYPGAAERCDDRANDCGASWTEANEAGIVSLESAAGAWSDETAAFTGKAATHELTAPGTLWLCSGAYSGSIALQADVDVRGRGEVTLDADGLGPVISVDAGVLADIEGVTLTGGLADRGGGLSVAAGASVTVTDTVLLDNTATTGGGGLYAEGGAVSLLRVEVTGNTAAFGGGIALTEHATLTAEETEITSNAASQDGGGVYANGLDKTSIVTVTMRSTRLEDNTAGKHSGALHAVHAEVSLASSAVQRNEATAAGGGLSVSFASVALSDTAVSGNNATSKGAALYLEDNGQVSCKSSTSSTSSSTNGVYGNTGTYAVYFNDVADYDDANQLTSAGCDWGLEGDDNEDGDVYLGTVYRYSLDEDFTCTSATGCR